MINFLIFTKQERKNSRDHQKSFFLEKHLIDDDEAGEEEEEEVWQLQPTSRNS